MQFIPLHGRNDVPFRASLDDVIRTLGQPDTNEQVSDVDSHPKGRRILRYGDFSVTIGSALGAFGMSVQAPSKSLMLWDTEINNISVQEFAALLASHSSSESAPEIDCDETEVYSAELGVLAFFADSRLRKLEIQIPYSCPTTY